MGNFEPDWSRFLHPLTSSFFSNDLFEGFSMGQMGNLDQIAPNLCNFISHDPL